MGRKPIRNRIDLRRLKAFESVARLGSVTAAATELGITQSAVSHQIRRLQAELGETVMQRAGRGIELTEVGRRLANSLEQAFTAIDQSTSLALQANRHIVRVGTYPSFAMGWLIKTIPSFLKAHPEIDLRLVMLYDPHEVSSRLADVLLTSEPISALYQGTRLFSERLLPVAAVHLGEELGAMPALITNEVTLTLAGRDWEAFSEINAFPEISGMRLLCCSHYIMALEMVREGIGAGLLPDYLVQPLLERGVLRRLPGKALPTGQLFNIQVRRDQRNDEGIELFCNWLRKEVKKAPFVRAG